MAAGELTNIEHEIWGTKNVVFADVEGPASYAAGGFALIPADAGLSGIVFGSFVARKADGTWLGPLYDVVTNKLLLIESKASGKNAEVADAEDVSGATIRLLAIATGRT